MNMNHKTQFKSRYISGCIGQSSSLTCQHERAERYIETSPLSCPSIQWATLKDSSVDPNGLMNSYSLMTEIHGEDAELVPL